MAMDLKNKNYEILNIDSEMERNAKKTNLSDSLGLIVISPVKTHGLAIGSKIKAACEKLERSFEVQKDIVAVFFDIEKTELSSHQVMWQWNFM